MTKAKTESKQGTAIVFEHRDWLRILSIIVCVIGIGVAGYLSWAEVAGEETVCVDAGKIDCSAVQNSTYAKTLGVPVAVMGLLGYLGILAVLVLEDQLILAATYGRTAIVGMALFGVMFSLYLSYLEGTVLDAWCQWCITSAILITILLGIGIYRLYLFMQPLRQ